MLRTLILTATLAAVLAVGATASPALARDMVLALSWQAGFCEVAGRNKEECHGQSDGGFDAAHFVLHGLWPQPAGLEYCGVAETEKERIRHAPWRRLSEPELTPATRRRLVAFMPGARSNLHRHEWHKHGTCSEMTADSYFRQAFDLVQAMADTRTGRLVRDAVGRDIPTASLCEALIQDFGTAVLRSADLDTATRRHDGGRRVTYLTGLNLFLKPDERGGLGLEADHLAGRGGRLACDDRPLRIDTPGLDR